MNNNIQFLQTPVENESPNAYVCTCRDSTSPQEIGQDIMYPLPPFNFLCLYVSGGGGKLLAFTKGFTACRRLFELDIRIGLEFRQEFK